MCQSVIGIDDRYITKDFPFSFRNSNCVGRKPQEYAHECGHECVWIFVCWGVGVGSVCVYRWVLGVRGSWYQEKQETHDWQGKAFFCKVGWSRIKFSHRSSKRSTIYVNYERVEYSREHEKKLMPRQGEYICKTKKKQLDKTL